MKKIYLLLTLPSLLAICFLTLLAPTANTATNNNEDPLSKKHFNKKFRADNGIGTAKDKFARFTWEMERLVDPSTGKIPPFMREKEIAYTNSLSKNLKKSNPENLEWKHRGPYNVGGRTRAFGIDRTNEDLMLAGSVSGGVWKTIDAGQNWYKVGSTMENVAVTTLIQDPRPGKENEWYYGTGELFGASASETGAFFVGNGVYKSTDFGETWESMAATAQDSPQNFNSNWEGIWRIAIDPTNLDQTEMYVATYATIFRTEDDGQNWTAVLGGNSGGDVSYFSDIDITSDGICYATMSGENDIISFGNGPDKGIWRSEDGINWTNILPTNFPPAYNRIALDISPSLETQLYFLVSNVDSLYGTAGTNTLGETEYNALWKYNYIDGDGSGIGGEWVDLSQNILPGPDQFDDLYVQSGYDLTVAVHPTDPETVFIGGTNLYRSTDGFSTSDNVTYVGGYAVGTNLPIVESYPNHHSDQHGMAFLPSNPDILFSYHDGGISRTDNCLADEITWETLNNGYISTQFYTIAINKKDTSNYLAGGLQDNGTYYTNDADVTSEWKHSYGADGGFTAIPHNEDYIIVSTQRGRILKVQIDEEGNRLAYERIDPALDRDEFAFINPWVLDPNDQDILYTITDHELWVNQFVSQYPFTNSWDSISNGWTMLQDTLAVTGKEFTAIAVCETPANRVYLGTDGRNMYRVDDATDPTSPLIDITNTSAQIANIGCIAVHPDDGDKLLCVFTNYGLYSLWYSEDAGETWVKAAGNLEEFSGGAGNGPSIRWASILPVTADSTAYIVGTSAGLYMTGELNELDTEWTRVSENLIGNNIITYVDSRPLDGLIVAASHGSGVFTANTPEDPPLVNIENHSEINEETVRAWPVPANDILNIEIELLKTSDVTLHLIDMLGRNLGTVNHPSIQNGKQVIQIEVNHLTPGTYYLGIETENFLQHKRFIVGAN